MPDRKQLLSQANVILSKCGRPMAPRGSAYVDIPTGYLYQTVTQAGTSSLIQSEPCVVDGDTTFILRAISGFNSIVSPFSWPSYFYRIKFPDGSYYNGNWSASINDWAFGRGSWKMTIDQEVSCAPGSEFIIDLSPGANPANVGNPQIFFEGVLRYLIRTKLGRDPLPVPPRYVRSPNQNIMAPEWMTGSRMSETPAGWQDEYRQYVSPTITASITTGQVTPALSVACGGEGGNEDFVWNETRATAIFTGSAAGTPVIKITLPDGYALTDNFVQVAEIQGPMPKPAIVPAGRSLLVDVSVFGASGTGNCNVILYLKGARRKRAA